MANNNIEIEIQVQIEHFGPLLEFLNKNATFISENHQIDEYFTPPHKNFIETFPVTEWLRLRNSNGKYFINYKKWHYDSEGKSTYCDEVETKTESLDQLKQILTLLSFKSLTIVDKVRKSYQFENYEIAIDSVKSLGDFVEIEYIGTETDVDPKVITSEMITFLKKLGCGEIKRNHSGYPAQLLFPAKIQLEKL